MLHDSSKGFTLIEVMIATAVGILVVLMAFAAVRSAGQVIRSAQRQAALNDMLRYGYIAAMDDADYWNSHAAPWSPFLQGAMSQDNGNPDSVALDKRMFRPIDWKSAAIPGANPFAIIPGTQGFWHRSAPTGGTQPFSRSASMLYATQYGYRTVSDACTIFQRQANYKERWDGLWELASSGSVYVFRQKDPTQGAGIEAEIMVLPAGWDPWHIYGDYAAIGNVERIPTRPGGAVGTLSDNKAAAMYRAFGQLGHAGVLAYMPPGVMNVIQRPATNRTSALIRNPSSYFDVGEIPWVLGEDQSGAASSSSFDILRPYGASGPLASRTDVAWRYNWTVGGPSMWPLLGLINTENDKNASVYTPSFSGSGSLRHWLMDYQFGTGSLRYAVGMIYDGRPESMDQTQLDPFRGLYDESSTEFRAGNALSGFTHLVRRTLAPLRDRYESTTGLVPQAPTNYPALRNVSGNGLLMRLGIFRMHYAGADRAYIRIIVVDPVNDHRYEVPMTVLGADLRGARAAWGVRSVQGRTPSGIAMGDTP